MQTARKIEGFLNSAGSGRLWVVVSWADVTGLAWLGEHTYGRPVILIIDDTRPHIFNLHRREVDNLPPETYDEALRFLERRDVQVHAVVRRAGSRVHRKNFVIESPSGAARSAVVGSPNLSKFGLFRNEETLVHVSPSELPEVWHQTSSLLEQTQPAGERIAGYIRNSKEQLTGYLKSPGSIEISAKLAALAGSLGNDLESLLEGWVDHLSVVPHHVRSSLNPIRYTIFGWNQLNSVLSYHRLAFPRVRIVHEQGRGDINVNRSDVSPDSPDRSYVDVLKLYERINEGGTLVVSSIHECDRTLDRVRLTLQRLFGIKININSYLSSKAERGLGLHWDSHDVLILQTEGRKHWTVYKPTRDFPVDRDIDYSSAEPTEVALDVVLEPGDLLYIPRGWWHDVIATGSPSLHLTIGFQWRTVSDYLRWLVDEMLAHEIVRQDIPRDIARQEAVLDVVSGILLQEVDPASGSLARYLRRSTAAIPIQSTASLPLGIEGVALPDTGKVVSNCNGMLSVHSSNDKITIEVDDRSFSLPGVCSDIVQHVLASNGPVSVATIRSFNSEYLSIDEIDHLLVNFASYGLISILHETER